MRYCECRVELNENSMFPYAKRDGEFFCNKFIEIDMMYEVDKEIKECNELKIKKLI